MKLTPKDFDTNLECEMYMILKSMADELESCVTVDQLEGNWMGDGEALVHKLEREKSQ